MAKIVAMTCTAPARAQTDAERCRKLSSSVLGYVASKSMPVFCMEQRHRRPMPSCADPLATSNTSHVRQTGRFSPSVLVHFGDYSDGPKLGRSQNQVSKETVRNFESIRRLNHHLPHSIPDFPLVNVKTGEPYLRRFGIVTRVIL